MMTTTMNSLRRTYMVTMIATAIDRRTGRRVDMKIPMDVPQKMVDKQLWDCISYKPVEFDMQDVARLNESLYKWIYQRCKINMSLMGYQIDMALQAEFYSTAHTYVAVEY